MIASTLAFAHRGWHLHHIENTMGAMGAAYAAGCDGVEFDVQLTRDGVPVLFHDDDLLRLAGSKDRVCDLTWEKLREIRLQENGNRASIPTLEDFLGQYGQKPFYLELKIPEVRHGDKAYYERLAMLCLEGVRLAKPHAQTFLASFHRPLMTWLAATQPGCPLGMIYEDEDAFESVMSSERETPKPPPWLHSLEVGIWQKRTQLKLALPAANQIWLWGLRTESEMRDGLEAGLGGLVVDDVPTLLRLVGRN